MHDEDMVAYLRYLKAQAAGPLTVLWDRAHDSSQRVRNFLARHPDIRTERLTAYAPEPNPAELVWAWTKYGRLGNFAVTPSLACAPAF